MGAISKAFKSIGKGLEKAIHAAGQIAKGVVTLDLKGAARGIKNLASAAADVAVGAIDLTPAALAANKLTHGALDKVMNKVKKAALSVTNSMVDSFEQGLSSMKNGALATVKGIAHGNLREALGGIANFTMGALDTASNFGPGGVAKNVARMAVETGVGLAAQKVAEKAAGALASSGNSTLGYLAVGALGAAADGAMGSSRGGRGRGHASPGDFSPVDNKRRNVPNAVAGEAPSRRASSFDSKEAANVAANAAVDTVAGPVSQQVMYRYGLPLQPNDDAAGSATTASQTAGAASEARLAASRRIRHAPSASKREAIESTAQDAMGVSLNVATQLAITSSVLSMSPHELSALASLGPDALSSLTPTQQLNATALRDSLYSKIENVVQPAIQGGTQTISDAAMKTVDAAESGSLLAGNDKLHDTVHDTLAGGIRDVTAGVAQALADVTQQAQAAGLGDIRNPATQPLVLATGTPQYAVQTADEIRLRA